jgi:hypothetical protein
VQLILKILGWKCWCKKTTRIFSDHEGYYLRCLDCGRRLAYDWAALGVFDPMFKSVDPGRDNGCKAELQ